MGEVSLKNLRGLVEKTGGGGLLQRPERRQQNLN